MKKILAVLCILLVLVGCAAEKGYSQISNGDEVIFTGPNGDYTRQDLYKVLKVSGEEAIKNDILKTIATKLDVDFSQLEKDADDAIEMYKQYGYETYIIYQYGSIDAYKQSYINSGILNELSKIYVNDKFNEFYDKDKPVLMKMVNFDNEEAATNMINSINSGATFETAATNNGYSQEVVASVYTDTDTMLPFEVKEYIADTNNTGLSKVITSVNTSQDAEGNIVTNNTYYVLSIVDRDVNNFKDEYIGVVIEGLETNEVSKYMFENHDIEYFDQDIYNMMNNVGEAE